MNSLFYQHFFVGFSQCPTEENFTTVEIPPKLTTSFRDKVTTKS